MKPIDKLFLFILLIVPFMAFCDFPYADKQFLVINNLVPNPGFEQGKARWAASGGTHSAVTTFSNVASGAASNSFTASAGNQSFRATLVNVPAGLYTRPCLASMSYKGGDSNLVFKIEDGGGNSLATVDLSTQANFKRENLVFTCPSSGTFRPVIYSRTAASLIYVDDFYLGEDYMAGGSIATVSGLVTNPRLGLTKFASANLTNGGSCAVSQQDGTWITSVSDPGAGRCGITFASSFFSSAPNCVVTISNDTSGGMSAGVAAGCAFESAPTTSGVTVRCAKDAAGASDADFTIMCMGPG